MLISEFCYFYKAYTFELAWVMPARRFFSLLKSSRRFTAMKSIDQIDIAMVPACGAKLYEHLRNKYMTRIDILEGNVNLEALRPDDAHLKELMPLTEEQQAMSLAEIMAMHKRANYGR